MERALLQAPRSSSDAVRRVSGIRVTTPHARPYPRPGSGHTIWTVADLVQLPDDGNRYEILHGELLVTPPSSNGHQGVAGRLFVRLANWCAAHTGWACRTPGGASMSESNRLEPDIAVYPAPEYSAQPWREMPPLHVVEVASPSTRRRVATGSHGHPTPRCRHCS